jgi:hypothetical protein
LTKPLLSQAIFDEMMNMAKNLKPLPTGSLPHSIVISTPRMGGKIYVSTMFGQMWRQACWVKRWKKELEPVKVQFT